MFAASSNASVYIIESLAERSAGTGVVSASNFVDYASTCSMRVLIRREYAHASDVTCVRWNPCDPGIFATAGDDLLIKLWTIAVNSIRRSVIRNCP